MILICTKCNESSDIPDCVTCTTWTCPKCGNVNALTTPPTEDWLETGICTYNGPGSDLPTGGYSKIPGWYPEKVAKTWIVMDAESEEGIAIKKTKELVADDIIIGVTMNLKTLAYIASTYGRDFYKIKDANDNEMTLDQWAEKYPGTNGLGLVAIRNMRRKLGGGGIKF